MNGKFLRLIGIRIVKKQGKSTTHQDKTTRYLIFTNFVLFKCVHIVYDIN
jgi:hypothetical protein